MNGRQLISSINSIQAKLDACSKLQSALFRNDQLRGQLNEVAEVDSTLVLSGIEISLGEYKDLLERALEETTISGVTFK